MTCSWWHLAGGGIFNFLRKGKVYMNKSNDLVKRIKMGVGIALLAILMGCAAYVGDGYYGGAVVVPGPEVYYGPEDFGLFGFYRDERNVHEYSHRGFESRGAAHFEGGGGGRGGGR